MKKIQTLIIMLFLQLPHIVQCNSIQNTWYAGNKIGFSQYHNIITYYIDKLIIYNNTNDSIHNSHIGYGAFVGYECNQYFNFELGYNWLGKIIYTNNEIRSIFKVQNIDIGIRLHYPIINKKTDVYTKIGGAIWHANVKNTYFDNDTNIYCSRINDTSLSPILSFGVEYNIKKHWKTRLEYQRITNIGEINTIGAQSNNSMINVNILYMLK